MAEPVLRDPVSPEPARRSGPQAVRAATNPDAQVAEIERQLAEEPLPELPAHATSASNTARSIRTDAVTTDAVGAVTGRTVPSSTSPVSTPPLNAPPASPRTTRLRLPKARSSSQEMLQELRTRLEELRERIEKQTEATRTSLKRELTQDADYLKIRARYYHERRPLQAVGIVAAAGFALGLFVGLWRR